MESSHNALAKYADEKKSDKKDVIDNSEFTCSHCSHPNDIKALFCAECGEQLCAVSACLKCGQQVSLGADTCDKCGEWLQIEGLCRFCYAPVEEGEIYCSECGNPLSGITCPSCHQISYSEFCDNCFAALTDNARLAIEMMHEDVEFQRATWNLEVVTPVEVGCLDNKSPVGDISDDVNKLRAYKSRDDLPKPQKKLDSKNIIIFGDAQKSSIEKLNAELVEEEHRLEEIRMKEEEHKKKVLEKRQQLERQGNIIFLKNRNVTITVRDENCALDDAYILYVNNNKIGLVDHGQGGFTTHKANLVAGENTIKLALNQVRHSGSWFTVSVMPGGRKLSIGGTNDHFIMVVVEE